MLRKTAKSTPFTTYVDKLKKIETNEIDQNLDSERAQELSITELGDVSGTATVYIRSKDVTKSQKSLDTSSRRKVIIEPEMEDSSKAPVSTLNIPDTQESEENGSEQPRRVRILPVRYRQ